ncbi:MAG: hypothetical protein AAF661_17235 [Pseudomonadota bacterium]
MATVSQIRRMSVLLTGFEPFGPWRVNSSWEGACHYAATTRRPVRLLRLPVDHALAAQRLRDALDRFEPEICLMTGLAAGVRLRLERRARRPEIADWPEGPDSRAGDWRWGAAQSRLRSSVGPSAYSTDAGQYVCESAYRALLDWRAEAARPCAAAFLHVPPLSRTWPVARIAAAIEATLSAQRA